MIICFLESIQTNTSWYVNINVKYIVVRIHWELLIKSNLTLSYSYLGTASYFGVNEITGFFNRFSLKC